MDCVAESYWPDGGWIPISEIREAVDRGFLSEEEGRLVVWSQLPVLRTQALATPPPITKT